MRDTFTPRKKISSIENKWERVCEAGNSMKEKKDGLIERRTCEESGKQKDFLSEEDTASQQFQWKQWCQWLSWKQNKNRK